MSEKKEERRKQLVEEYETKRNSALLESARSRLQQGDEEGAQLAVEQLLKQAPDNVGARLLKAELLLLRYELAEAKQEIEGVLAKEPQNALALHSLGLVQEALGESEQAAENFGKAAELEPNNPLVSFEYQTMMDPRYASPGERPEQNDPAASSNPQETDPAVIQSSLASELEQSATNPRSAAILRRAAQSLAERQSEVAITQFRQAMRLDSENVRLPHRAALQALQLNQPNVASSILESALETHTRSVELYRLYGLALYRQGLYPESERALRKTVSLDNRDALAYFLLGQSLARLGQTEQSQQILAEACRLDASLAGSR